MRYIHLLNALLLTGLLLGSAYGWVAMPEPMREELDAWFFPPALAVVLAAAGYAMARALPDRLHLINLPDRERMLALPAERREPVVRAGQRLFHWLAAEAIILACLIQLLLYRRAHDPDDTLSFVLIVAFGVGFGPVITYLVLAGLMSETSRQIREHRKERGE